MEGCNVRSREFFADLIESEAEGRFLDGMDSYCESVGIEVGFHNDDPDPPMIKLDRCGDGKQDSVLVMAQYNHGSYRIDFLFMPIYEPIMSFRWDVAVEIDGHAWHERTHREAAAQRARDRWLLRHNTLSVRFAAIEVLDGSPMAMAEVLAILQSLSNGDKKMIRENVEWFRELGFFSVEF